MPEALFIIDAFAHIYQFFYAIRGLTGPDGEPVNAVYGLARMIESLRQKYRPDYMAVAFDGPGELVRRELYEDYKAGRPPMPDDLSRQLPLIHEMLEALGVPEVSAEGYEADDVLAAAARQANAQGIETVIVTTDKDAEQLIDEQTRVLHIHKDREELLDPEALKELKGIEPGQVVDVMSLAGDSTDNVPGVPGIGPKTALKLIRQFGSVEGLYADLDRVESEKTRQTLAEHRDDVELSARLVTLRSDIGLDLDLGACRTDNADPGRARAFYKALGFRSLLGQAPPAPAPGGQQGALFAGETPADQELATLDSVETDYSTVATLDELERLLGTLRDLDEVSVDLETTSLEPRKARIVGFSFSWEPHQAVYVPTGGPPGARVCPLKEAVELLRPVLEAKRPAKLGQNLKYDMAVLKNYGVELGGLACDSMVASYLLRPAARTHNLDDLARRHLAYETIKIGRLLDNLGKDGTMDQVPLENVAPYACEDADVALQLCRTLSGQLREEDLWELFNRLELPLVPVLAAMEWTGVTIDQEQLDAISTEFAERLQDLERDIFREAGREFNVNSPQQLSRLL